LVVRRFWSFNTPAAAADFHFRRQGRISSIGDTGTMMDNKQIIWRAYEVAERADAPGGVASFTDTGRVDWPEAG
jgi:hypothetical protein